MWDWYTRPGRRSPLRTRTALLVMIIGGLLVGVLFTLFYTLIAPYIFRRLGA